MKKMLVLSLLTCFGASGAVAATMGGASPTKVGIGVGQSTLFGSGTGDNETTIMVPIVSGNIMFEPFFAYSDTELSSSGTQTDVESWSLGAGLFADVHRTQKTSAYIGGRAWFSDMETTSGAGASRVRSESDGWGIAPTMGFAWRPAGDNFSLGGEVFVSYFDGDSDVTAGGVKTSGDAESTSTGTRFFMRYLFD